MPTSDMSSAYSSIDPAALADYVRKIGFDCKEKPEKRVCKQDSNKCRNPGSDRTNVTVGAAQGSNSIGQLDGNNGVKLDPGTNGYVIARFINNDPDKAEYWLQIPPNDTAYWLIEPYNGAVQSRFFTIKMKYGNWVKTELIHAIPGFAGCGNPNKHDEEAGFANCDLSPYSVGPAPLSPTIEDVKSSWISCVAGCCTTEGVRGQGTGNSNKKSSGALGSGSPHV